MKQPVFELIRKFTCNLAERHNSESMLIPHYHDVYEIYFQLEGKRYMCFNGIKCLMQRGDLFIAPPFVTHGTQGHKDGYYKRYVVNFSLDDLKPIFTDDEINDATNNFTVGIMHLTEEQIYVVYDYLQKIDDYHIRYSSVARKMEFATLYMLLDYLNILAKEQALGAGIPNYSQNKISLPIAKSVDYIKNNYNSEITLDFISHYAGLSKSQFCNAFKSSTGITFITYLNNYRVAKAHLLISRTKKPLHKIAADTGFYSTEHMTRSFRKLFGMSPSKWRKTYVSDIS